ncbi:MAG: site-specific integrase, partial [Thiohalocapsa sp.]
MATITKRSSRGRVVYQAKIRSKHGSASATFPKLTDARRWAAETETKLARGEFHAEEQARKRTVGDVLKRYLASPAFAKITEQDTRKAHLRWWDARLGKVSLDKLTPALIAEGRDALKAEGKADATANRYLAALSKALSLAVGELGWLPANPCSRVEKFDEDNSRDRVLTDAELQRLVDACKSPDVRDLVILARYTAARRGELTGLLRSDVDLKRKLLTFRDTKNGETRSVALVEPALGVVKRRMAGVKTDLLFPQRRDPRKPAEYREAFNSAVKRAGLDGFTFHGLRHTCLTALATSGATLSELRAIAGHKSMEMVLRYQHLC